VGCLEQAEQVGLAAENPEELRYQALKGFVPLATP
jgi:hypothetical protein